MKRVIVCCLLSWSLPSVSFAEETGVSDPLCQESPADSWVRSRARDLALQARRGAFEDFVYKPGRTLGKHRSFCYQHNYQRHTYTAAVLQAARESEVVTCELPTSFYPYLKAQLRIVCELWN